MADVPMLNKGIMSGLHGGIAFADEETTEITVMLVDVPFEKSADKEVWFNGLLTYTLSIDNTDSASAITNLEITDQLDVTLFDLDEDTITVTINGAETTNFTHTYAGGLLTVTIADTIPGGADCKVSFSGSKVEVTP